MNYYEIWCNLKDSRRDVEFAQAVHAYLSHLRDQGLIAGFTLTRRKLGFGPSNLGEFNITVMAENLEQLDRAFDQVSARSGETERLHMPVYQMVTDFTAALYRDFPDPTRQNTAGQPT